MKADYVAKIENNKRHELKDVVPLDKPYSLMIDIADVCNMKCKFCFHADLDAIKKVNAQFGVMPMNMFIKIVDDIKTGWGGDFGIKKLRLFANGEPLLNKNALKMISYAKSLHIAEKVEMTTNGSLINDEIADNICGAGLDILNISVNGLTEDQYRDVCGYHMDFDYFIQQIRRLYNKRGNCRVQIKYSDIGYSDDEKKKFVEEFGDICDQIFVESISSSLWPDTDVNEKVRDQELDFWGGKYKKKKICPSIFTQMVINSRGKAKLCCSDWGSRVIVGDASTQSVKEIWERGYVPLQKRFLMEERGVYTMCKECSLPEAASPDNLDDYAKEVILRYDKY